MKTNTDTLQCEIPVVAARYNLPSPMNVSRWCLFFSTMTFTGLIARNYSDQCYTVSCVTDKDELSDRLGTLAFASFGVSAFPLYAYYGTYGWIAALDAIASFLLSVLSYDVSEIHVPLAIAFTWLRLGAASTWTSRLPKWGVYIANFVMPTIGHTFFFSYACPYLLSETCGTVRFAIPLATQTAMLMEGSFLLVSTILYFSATCPQGLPVTLSRVPAISLFLSTAMFVLITVHALAVGESMRIVPLFAGWSALLGWQGFVLYRRGTGYNDCLGWALLLVAQVPFAMTLISYWVQAAPLIELPPYLSSCERRCPSCSQDIY